MSTTDQPSYNRSPDGSFMDFDEIVSDVIANRLSDDSKAQIVEGLDGFTRHHQFGQWIRNAYGLWAEDNPLRALWDAERPAYCGDGCDASPHHPDNYSARIVDAIEAKLRAAA